MEIHTARAAVSSRHGNSFNGYVSETIPPVCLTNRARAGIQYYDLTTGKKCRSRASECPFGRKSRRCARPAHSAVLISLCWGYRWDIDEKKKRNEQSPVYQPAYTYHPTMGIYTDLLFMHEFETHVTPNWYPKGLTWRTEYYRPFLT